MERNKLFQELAETHYQIHALYYKLFLKDLPRDEKQLMYDLIDVMEKQALELKAEVHI